MSSCKHLSAAQLVAAVFQDPDQEKTQPIPPDINIDFVLGAVATY
jgi:hypothetical protein